MSTSINPSINPGQLYIVATPIGNLEDITLRALATLRSVDVILAEDTRHSRRLLQHYDINKPLVALHQHNERGAASEWVARCQQGERVALISDAGTPLISDPGFCLVQAMREAGVPVVPIPGPCALIAALSASGLATDAFFFRGFLPAKATARREALRAFLPETATVALYEAPHRIVECLEDVATVLGPTREIVLAKELTKQFETLQAGTVASVLHWLQEDPLRQKGEFVILIAGVAKAAQTEQITISTTAEALLTILLAELPLKQAVQLAVKLTGGSKNEWYTKALAMQKEPL